jgi:hypothetical protein
MATQPTTDRGLAETAGRQNATGARLSLLGGVLFAIGVVLALIGDDGWNFAGVVFMALATPPTLAGIALHASSLVSHRSSEQKPFA